MVEKTCKHKLVFDRQTSTHAYYKCEKCNYGQGRVLKNLLDWYRVP